MGICKYCHQEAGRFSDWHFACKQKADADAKTLADQQKKERDDENKRKSELLLGKHGDLIDRFLELAERRISALDEYGDEQWDALPDEIEKCLAKIAKREKPTFEYRDTETVYGIASYLKRRGKLNESRSLLKRAKSVYIYRDEYVYLAESLEQKVHAHHNTRESSAIGSSDVGKLAGVDFENHVATLLKNAGFSVVGTPVTGDQGADFIAKKDGKTFAIQVKGWAGSVGNGAVQEIVAAIKFYNANEGWVVTNSTFTSTARRLAQANNIRLIDGHDLKNAFGG